jgi:beta-lactamase regulating signal transducer with metallopeptidase domain
MSNLISPLIQYSLIYCLIIGLILCLRGPTYRIAGARWAYALWFTLFIPLVVPLMTWLVSSPFSFSSIGASTLLDHANSIIHANSSGIIAISAACIWLGGVMITALRAAHVGLRLKLALNANSQGLTKTQEREFSQICSKLRVFPSPEVRVCPDIEGPALFGILNPIVYLPDQFFDRFTASERTLMMFHELCHYQRKDAWWNALFCLLNCLFWFNPLIRHAERRFRLDQEQSCDQFVLWDEPKSLRALYASAMMKIASPAKSVGLIHFQSNAPEILGRVTLLEQHKKTLPQSLFGFASLAVLIFIVLIASAPVTAAVDPIGLSTGWCSIYQQFGM